MSEPLVIDNLEEELHRKLIDVARHHGRSVKDEVTGILREALAPARSPGDKLGSRIAACFAGKGLEADIPEFRGELIEPPSFEP
jgi:plasmid stability protein